MTKKGSALRRSFILSITSLVLCLVMLIGTTYAWFSESIASDINTIRSGSLDVELEYYKGGKWNPVRDASDIFGEALWEPGYTEVIYLRLSNKGTLAFKYKLGVNIVAESTAINVYNEQFKLSDFIQFGAVEGVNGQTGAFESRAQAIAAAEASTSGTAKLSEGYSASGKMETTDSEKYIALVVYMPTTVGNEANYQIGTEAPTIDLGINLVATQQTYETDSFDNSYDKDSVYTGIPVANVTSLALKPTVESISGESYALDAAYVFATTESAESARESKFAGWNADFVVTFNRDVDFGAFGLAGQYDAFSTNWVAFEVEKDMFDFGTAECIKANDPIRMLSLAGFAINYEELCDFVKEFNCGAFAVKEDHMMGVTMTVELRLFETDANGVETGKYESIGTYSHTFEGFNTEYVNVEEGFIIKETVTLYDKFGTGGQTGEVKITAPTYTFTAKQTTEEAETSRYANWIADYFVSTDKAVEDGIILIGNYGTYGWLGFHVPESDEPYTPTGLLGAVTAGGTSNWTYTDIVENVKEFKCGIINTNPDNVGVTVTVVLRLTDKITGETYDAATIVTTLKNDSSNIQTASN